MADSDALRQRRRRAHLDNDHRLCRPGRCRSLTVVPDGATAPGPRLRDAVIAELGGDDEMLLALGLRLVELTEGTGAAAVSATRALAELIASAREDVR